MEFRINGAGSVITTKNISRVWTYLDGSCHISRNGYFEIKVFISGIANDPQEILSGKPRIFHPNAVGEM